MKFGLVAMAVAAALVGLVLAGPGETQARPGDTPGIVVDPVTGTFEDRFGGDGTFAGTFEPRRFVLQKDTLYLVGELTGTLTDSKDNEREIKRIIRVPVDLEDGATTGQGATCPILDLNLGPLDLNLLGLVVHLDPIVLTIDAQSGPGQLLGNLLCGLVSILDQPTAQGPFVRLLNILLGLLGQ